VGPLGSPRRDTEQIERGGSNQILEMRFWALIMASATPVSSEGGTSISARAERGVRGFQHDAESPQVADAVIEARFCQANIARTAQASRADRL
jgi:hypothetical protein